MNSDKSTDNLSKSSQKEMARILYFNGFKQQDIAHRLRISPNTISRWKKDGEWDYYRARKQNQEGLIMDKLGELISYQLNALDEMTKDYEKNRDENGKLPLISSSDLDGLTKMLSKFKHQGSNWETYIRISKDLVSYIFSRDLELAKKLEPLVDDYIMVKKGEF